MKCKRYSLQTIATKMEFALYETIGVHTSVTHTHTPHSFKRCHLSASVTELKIHPDSSLKRDRKKSLSREKERRSTVHLFLDLRSREKEK